MKIRPIILSGGYGTRLWPLSREMHAKQFVNFFNEPALFQKTVSRIFEYIKNSQYEFSNITVITSLSSKDNLMTSLDEDVIDKLDLIFEPNARNSAPALTLGALFSKKFTDDEVLIIFPSDHFIESAQAFHLAIEKAINLALIDNIVVLGVRPQEPSSAYGYIEIKSLSSGVGEVKAFIEKPDLELAKTFVSNPDYYWNCGIFILKSSIWIEAIKKYRPDIYEQTSLAYSNSSEISPDLYKNIPSDSIDYAAMERIPYDKDFSMKMCELSTKWSDLGSWDAIWKLYSNSNLDEGNLCFGDVFKDGVKNSLLYSTSRLVSAVGLEDIVLIETSDAVLVANMKNSQNIKTLVNQLAIENRAEKRHHRMIRRPWGFYDVVDENEHFKVKRITVFPNADLSLQSHKYRSEHWVVVSGVALVHVDGENFELTANQSTYVAAGKKHRLTNKGSDLLVLIEVQTGEYLGEDDITRYEDTYGRT